MWNKCWIVNKIMSEYIYDIFGYTKYKIYSTISYIFHIINKYISQNIYMIYNKISISYFHILPIYYY